jgi:hypothetical protein
MQALRELDWIGVLESDGDSAPRIVLLAQPQTTPLLPLAHALLLPPEALPFWSQNGLQPLHNLRGALLNE